MEEFERGGPEGRQEIKAIKMPTGEQLTEKLKEGNFLGIAPQRDAFYSRFVHLVADIKKSGVGLNMAWELAQIDTMRDLPPGDRAVVNAAYDSVIDTVTPDPEVATQAKDIRRKMLEEMKKEQGK